LTLKKKKKSKSVPLKRMQSPAGSSQQGNCSASLFPALSLLWITLCLILCAADGIKAQTKTADITVLLEEQALNKLFTALGPVYGSDTYSMLFVKGTYHWTILNPHIELKENSASYVADVEVETGPLSYNTKVTGDVSIRYSPDSNKIIIRIVKATLPLYTNLFGSRVHIKDIDLAESYTEPFVFDGPLSLTTDMEFKMPDGNVRRMHAVPVHCDVQVKENQIVVPCEIMFVSESVKK
jgi:hypothetical protein